MAKVISFLNNKGGVSKTFTAFNVGIYWASLGKRILFIDTDSQGNLTTNFTKNDERYNSIDHKWERTLEDSFIGGPEIAPLNILPSRYENVDFVPADLHLSNFDRETSTVELRAYLLKDLLEPVKDRYDYIIIDCPPALGSIVTNVMVASDGIVLVTMPDLPSVDGMEMVIDLYNEIIRSPRMNPGLKLIGIVVGRVENDSINKTILGVIEKKYGNRVITPYVRKNTKISQAASLRRDIFSHDAANGKGASDMREVAKEILLRI